jgi:hypothetical protein
MKQIPENAVCIYTNEIHETQTRLNLRDAQRALQKLVNAWNELGLGPCENVNSLVLRPEKTYQDAIDKMIQVPVTPGPFRMKKADYIAGLDLPDISPLLAARKEAINMPYCASPDLWRVDINGKLIMDEKEAAVIIASRSIYACSEESIALAKDLQKACDLLNSLNVRLKGELLDSNPALNTWIRGKFTLVQPACNTPYVLSIDPEYLRSKLK